MKGHGSLDAGQAGARRRRDIRRCRTNRPESRRRTAGAPLPSAGSPCSAMPGMNTALPAFTAISLPFSVTTPVAGEHVVDFRRRVAMQAEPVAGQRSATPQVIPSVGVPPLENKVRQRMRPLTGSSQPSSGASASSRTRGSTAAGDACISIPSEVWRRPSSGAFRCVLPPPPGSSAGRSGEGMGGGRVSRRPLAGQFPSLEAVKGPDRRSRRAFDAPLTTSKARKMSHARGRRRCVRRCPRPAASRPSPDAGERLG